jgi:DNA-binding transcriptional MerR regulator
MSRVGAKRTYSGGVPQKYILDNAGRKLIKDRYDGSHAVVVELSTALSVPHRQVREWARKLGVAPKTGREWTEQEIKYLTRHLADKTFAEICEYLDRSVEAVRTKAYGLGLIKEREGYTMKDLCEGLGVSFDMARRWVDKGWICGNRRETGFWDFSDKDIRDFLRSHPMEVDLSKVDQLWFLDVCLDLGALDNPRDR